MTTDRTVERRGDHTVIAEEVWADPDPQPVYCADDHPKTLGVGQVCPDCHVRLANLVADLPKLIDHLRTAAIKDVRFTPTNNPNQVGSDDESPIPWNNAASLASVQLVHLARQLPRMTPAEALAQLSQAAWRAHRIIDRPADITYVGGCPRCGEDLWAERGTTVTCHNDTVYGPCTYQSDWTDHLTAALAGGEDRLLTISELVTALAQPRDRIKNATRRMAGVTVQRPHLDGHTITTRPVTMYRLGDVRAATLRR